MARASLSGKGVAGPPIEARSCAHSAPLRSWQPSSWGSTLMPWLPADLDPIVSKRRATDPLSSENE